MVRSNRLDCGDDRVTSFRNLGSTLNYTGRVGEVVFLLQILAFGNTVKNTLKTSRSWRHKGLVCGLYLSYDWATQPVIQNKL